MARLGSALTAAALGGIGLLMIAPVDDLDIWWLLGGGRYMVETRTFPTTDPFSGTAPGAEWINHAWGFQLVLYGVYAWAGITGLVVMQALFAVATFAVLYGISRREGVGQGWALALIVVGALGTRGFWAPRPQLVTYLGLAVFWAILRAYREGRGDRLAWLPPLTVLWVNLHGGFMIGLALIGLCLVALILERAFTGDDPVPSARRLLLFGVGSGLAAFVNPFHYRAVLFPFRVLEDRVTQDHIVEWSSPPFGEPQVMLLEGLLLLTLVGLVVMPRRGRLGDLLVLVVFTHLLLHAIRSVPLFVIVLVPIAGRVLSDCAARLRPALVAVRSWLGRRRVPAIATVLAVCAVAWWSLPVRQLTGLLPRLGVAAIYPAGAVEFLKREHRGGTVFNDYGWGGYLIWHLYPGYRVSIDGRAAVYGPIRLADHVEIQKARPGWRQKLDRLGVRLALIRTRSSLAAVLRTSTDWEVLYEDQIAIVLGRRGHDS